MRVFLCFGIISLLTLKNAFSTELKFNTQEFAPFNYTDGGKVAGPVSEIIAAVCKEMSYKCSFKSLPWTRAQKRVKEGKANGMFVIGWNEDRAKWLHFSHPIIQTGYGFFIKDSNKFEYKKPEDLNKLRVSVYGPSNTAKSLNKLKAQLEASGKGTFKIDMHPNDEPGFSKVSKARSDAVYSNKAVGESIIKKAGIKNLRFGGFHRNIKYYIGFSMKYNDKAVVDKFNDTYLKLYKNGTVQKILDKWSMKAAEI